MKKAVLLFTFLFLVFNSVASQTVYVTKTGEKYHSEGCRYLRSSSRSMDLKDAVSARYDACSVCKPETPKSNSASSQNFVSQKTITSESTPSRSVQCSGRTKKGAQCKRMTTNSSGRCYQH